MANQNIFLDIDKETFDEICLALDKKLTKDEAIKAYVIENRHKAILEEEVSNIKETLKTIVEIIDHGNKQ